MKDVKKQEEMWEMQHELAAQKIYAMCSDLGGFFLKVSRDFTLSFFRIGSLTSCCCATKVDFMRPNCEMIWILDHPISLYVLFCIECLTGTKKFTKTGFLLL